MQYGCQASCARSDPASAMNSALVWKVKLCLAAAAAVTASLQGHETQSSSKPERRIGRTEHEACELTRRLGRKCRPPARSVAAASSALALRPGDE
jgi:hypothetical protein